MAATIINLETDIFNVILVNAILIFTNC